jgi:hypothetical protein
VRKNLILWGRRALIVLLVVFLVTGIFGGASVRAQTITGGPSPFLLGRTGAVWTETNTPIVPANTPSGRYGHAMAALLSGDVLLFGGYDGSNYLGDTWLFHAGSQSWSQLSTASAPSARGFHAMATTPAGALLFGGSNGSGNLGDTWLFSASSQTWSLLSTASAPSARSNHAMAATPADDVLLFGGSNNSGSLNDTWLFDTLINKWSQIPVGPSAPSKRHWHAMADTPTGILLFGGFSWTANIFNDTWLFDSFTNTWSQITGSDITPPARMGHAMAATPAGDVLLFGGVEGGGHYLGETWLYVVSEKNWYPIGAFPYPPERSALAMATADAGVLLFGGQGSNYFNDTWIYGVVAPTPTPSPSPTPTVSPTPSPSPSPSPTPSLSFPDVPAGYWAYPEIMSLVGAGVVKGYPDGTFQPENPVTRAEFCKMILLSLGYALEFPQIPSFPDLVKDEWYYGYVEGVFKQGLIKGYPDHTFRPQGNITIAEILTICVRAKGWQEVAPPGPPPTILLQDQDGSVRAITAADWYYKAVGTAAQHCLLMFPDHQQIMTAGGGSDEYQLRFNTAATRAQTAVFLARMPGAP